MSAAPLILPVLATAERDGYSLRAYAAAARRPALPLFSAGDLARAVMPTRDDEVELLAGLGESDLAGDVRTVLTEDGPTLVVSHAAAFLVVTLVGRMGITPDCSPRAARAEALLADAVLDGTIASTRGMPFGRGRAWMWRAWRRDKARFPVLLLGARADLAAEARHA